MKNTRSRIECKKESDKTMSEIAEPTNDAISYNDQIVIEENGCMEYTVSKDQDIAVVTRGIKGLPIGECKIIAVYDSLNPNKYFEEWKFYTTGRNTLNNPEAQNVYTYFANEHNGVRRSFLINKWMIDNNIDEITVKICSK